MKDSKANCLVIPDLHQNVSWAKAILAKEAAHVERIIFLGDYFDPKVDSATSAFETAQFVSGLTHQYPSHTFTFLVGNHDLPYLYDLQHDRAPDTLEPNPYKNGAYNPYLSQEIKPALAKSFLASLQPFTFAGHWLLSHAGIHHDHLDPQAEPTRQTLEALRQTLAAALVKLSSNAHPAIAAIGTARGGTEPTGGLTWLDWHQEFQDSLPFPQIVGHTLLPEVSQKGRSYDLDTRAGHYALLTGDQIEIRSLSKKA